MSQLIRRRDMFSAVLLAASMLISSVASAITISGTLTLPVGIPDFSADKTIFIKVYDQSANNLPFAQQTVVVTAGSQSGDQFNFSIPGISNDAGGAWRVNYECNSFPDPIPCENIVKEGYYRSDVPGKVDYRAERATLLDGGVDHPAINMILMKGKSLSGTLSLPTGVAPVGGIGYRIFAKSVTGPAVAIGAFNFNIAEGASSGNYKLTLPNTNTESWTVYYDCHSSIYPGCGPYFRFGYYDSTAPNSTTDVEAQAEARQGGVNLTANMTLLTGYTLSGTIYVPDLVTNPAGLELLVKVQDANNQLNGAGVTMNIPQNAAQIAYTLTLPTDVTADWRVSYACILVLPEPCSAYVTTGYYDTSAINNTGASIFQATLLPGGMSYGPIDMTVIGGNTIAGSLKLSQGIAPLEGIEFIVFAIDTSGMGGAIFQTRVIIPDGSDSIDFSLNVDPGVSNTWQLHYDCFEPTSPACSDVTDKGYYDYPILQTVQLADLSASPELPGGSNYSGLVLDIQSSRPDVSSICFPISSAEGIAVICL